MGREADAKKLECPKCQVPLHERALKETGVRVDCCPTCHGMWFGIGELQSQLESIDEGEFIPPADARVTDRRCPACSIPMTAFEYLRTGVEIDLCETCRGVWLDVGVLRKLAGGGEGESAERKGGFLGLVAGALGELKFW